MRIITGIARGTKLKTLEGKDTRPTTEMCKEGVFSAIQFEIHDRTVLDLFGGCGQMALEALSRGAEKAVIIDNNRSATEIIKENALKTKFLKQCKILTADWKEYLRSAKGKESFDLIFLDPPYSPDILDEVLKKLMEADVVAPNAIIVCESDKDGIPEPLDGWNCKLYRYGKSYVTIIRPAQED